MAKKSAATRAYLLLYNVAQAALWASILLRGSYAAVHHVLIGPADPSAVPTFGAAVYDAVHTSVLRAQTLAWAEVAHVVLGLAGGGVATTLVQTLGRYVVVACVVDAIGAARSLRATGLLYVAWSLGDLPRYLLYIVCGLGHAPPRALVWLRYTVSLALQPVGISAEWMLYYLTLDHVRAVGLYKVEMPNTFNFAFDFATWNCCVLVSYVYFGPFMMRHLVRQRRSKLRSHTA